MASRATSRRWFLRDLPRAYVVLVWAAFGVAILAYFIDWSPKVPRDTAAQPPLNNGEKNDPDKVYTGSILVPTRRYDQCWEFMFDNRTGNMRDEGYVSCNKAAVELQENRPPAGMEATRLREVGKAFRNQ